MALDPVHFEGIAHLARSIERDVDDREHDDFAERVWASFLDPLQSADGRIVLEPIEEQFRGTVSVDDVALSERPFPTTHGLDSGTINPTTFTNGVVLDVAHAAMARDPSDHDLHRARSIAATIHTGDDGLLLPDEWVRYDEGFGRRRWIQSPRVSRFAEGVVHALSLYYAESEHALEHADEIEDLLLLDGPLYPKEVLSWEDRHPELARKLADEVLPRRVVENYVRLVEHGLDRSVPIVGFVKNPQSNRFTRFLREKRVQAPWATDAAFFRRILARDDGGEPRRDQLTFTNWFVSRAGTDRAFAAESDALDLEREHPPAAYEVTFMVLYDPRDDVVYRIEAPYGVTRDPELRTQLRRQLLADVATERGPPIAIRKADQLAGIGTAEKRSLRRMIETEWETDVEVTYDDVRWGGEEF